MRPSILLCALAACNAAMGSAFVLFVVPVNTASPSSSSASRLRSCLTKVSMSEGTPVDRRTFLSRAAIGAAGLGIGASAAFAADDSTDLGDLSVGVPTPMGITEGAPLSEDAARIQRKLAAQAKVTGKASSGRMTYSESMSSEQEKQARMSAEKKDKEKRRAAMCEELGRGC